MARQGIIARPRDMAITSRGPVHIKLLGSEPDQQRLQMAVDYSKADTPARSYYADFCEVLESRGAVSLVFGKLVSGAAKLRNKVEISFPRKMFVEQLWKSSREFEKTVKRLAEDQEFFDIGKVDDTDTVQTFRSNNVFMAVGDEEAVLDFYLLSPGDVRLAIQGKRSEDITLEPVLRVLVETVLMRDFLAKCRPHAEKWLEHFKIRIEDD